MSKKNKHKNKTNNNNAIASMTTSKNVSTTTTNKWDSWYKSTNYDYRGKKNETKFPDFVDMCKPSQEQLKGILKQKLIDSGYDDIVTGNGYLYAKGELPYLLTAHMDTVHKENVKDFYEYYDKEKNRHIISSPQGIGGDDRCGCYMITEIIKTHKCSVLFCEDEEAGCIGSNKFSTTELINELKELKYIIELDRMSDKDAVFYECDNFEFTDFIVTNSGYEESMGSLSDISILCPACGVAGVNFSCGYHNAHTKSEYVVIEEMLDTIEMVKNLLEVECNQFEYIESIYSYGHGYGRYSSLYRGWDVWDDDYDLDWHTKLNGKPVTTTTKTETERSLLIYVYDDSYQDVITYVSNAPTEAEAFLKFFKDNPSLSYNYVYDYVFYEQKICADGWYDYLM